MLGLRSRGRASLARLENLAGVVSLRSAVTVAATQDTARDKEWEAARPFDDIPGPKPLPLIGNVWRFLPGGTFHNMTDINKLHTRFFKDYGKICRFGGIPGRDDMIFVYDPDDTEKVFRNEGIWPIRDGMQSFAKYRNVTRKEFFEGAGGILSTQGEEWAKFRTTVNQPMMQPRVARHYITPIDEVADDFIKRIPALKDEKGEMPADFINELYKWALESIAMIALDTRLGCLDDTMSADSEPQKMIDGVQVIFDSMFELELGVPMWKIISTPTWRRYVKAMDYSKDVSMKYINKALERSASLKNEDRELSVLERILARDPNPKVACVMAIDMMTAGVDTTSNSVAFLLHYLAVNPEKQKKLQAEIDRVAPKSANQPITAEQLNDLKYLKACIKESMRMSSITNGNLRRTARDIVLQNYRIPKGTNIAIGNQLMCNMETHYPQAASFIPERWLKGDPGAPSTTHKTNPFVYLPFGFGPRMCVGRRFAELEIETLITKMMQNYTVEWHHGPMERESKLLNTAKSPLRFRMMSRAYN